MQQIDQYTTLFAPVLFFFSGIAIVILLNKFIGKKVLKMRQNEKRGPKRIQTRTPITSHQGYPSPLQALQG